MYDYTHLPQNFTPTLTFTKELITFVWLWLCLAELSCNFQPRLRLDAKIVVNVQNLQFMKVESDKNIVKLRQGSGKDWQGMARDGP